MWCGQQFNHECVISLIAEEYFLKMCLTLTCIILYCNMNFRTTILSLSLSLRIGIGIGIPLVLKFALWTRRIPPAYANYGELHDQHAFWKRRFGIFCNIWFYCSFISSIQNCFEFDQSFEVSCFCRIYKFQKTRIVGR